MAGLLKSPKPPLRKGGTKLSAIEESCPTLNLYEGEIIPPFRKGGLGGI